MCRVSDGKLSVSLPFVAQREQRDTRQFPLILAVDRNNFVLSVHSLGTVSDIEKGHRETTHR